ncbi:SPFH domain-containing protein [Spirochaeta thermophila]|uniref:Uncharacterized protein n=1 Tax=Winmispira thermophila (strain ATCC 49972 / DSM 6192 / RI 19.B1) TaxID=665571 RepID=E0RSN0_WINT6|nr:SPFH domain-containing protein [Spirochaeta thermophila]ADN02017.1 hypothetical protein STHERM_c10720 [Spirochaeta thermophila DSM 6192]
MKKFIIVLVILLLIGGAIFYAGWIQFSLDEHEYGVIFTKTSGWASRVVAPGEFVWRWERLIPTNLTLHAYPVTTRATDIVVEGGLPSADLFSEILPTSAEFSYRLVVHLSYRLRPSYLPSLAREGILPDDLEDWYENQEVRIRDLTEETFSRVISDTSLDMDAFGPKLSERFREEMPAFELLTLSVDLERLPDLEIYRQARQLYEEILKAQAEARRAAVRERAFREEREKILLERMERYGKVLQEYPILIEYFKLDPSNPDPLGILEGLE